MFQQPAVLYIAKLQIIVLIVVSRYARLILIIMKKMVSVWDTVLEHMRILRSDCGCVLVCVKKGCTVILFLEDVWQHVYLDTMLLMILIYV